MDSRSAQRYEIVIRGELSDRFEDWFDGVDLKTREEPSRRVIDQPHFHELLERAHGFGLRRVGVEMLFTREMEDELQPSRHEETSSRKGQR